MVEVVLKRVGNFGGKQQLYYAHDYFKERKSLVEHLVLYIATLVKATTIYCKVHTLHISLAIGHKLCFGQALSPNPFTKSRYLLT
jgi:hypothetical protein